jgi:transposase
MTIQSISPTPVIWLSKRAQAQRYGKSTRTIDRWMRDPRLNYPKQVKFNGRPHSKIEDHETWERSCALARAADPSTATQS